MSSNFYQVIVCVQFYFWYFVSCFLLCGREAIFVFDFLRLASCFVLLASCFLLWKPIDRFLTPLLLWGDVMAYNLIAACQFYSLFKVELASKTPTCIELFAWLWGPRQIAITDSALFFVSTWIAKICIALNFEQCTFNINASVELDASSICYLSFISIILALTSEQLVALISTTNIQSGFRVCTSLAARRV